MELDPQGIECMESALELCRAEEDEPGICLTLSNLGVAHVKQECHSLALACFQVVCVCVCVCACSRLCRAGERVMHADAYACTLDRLIALAGGA